MLFNNRFTRYLYYVCKIIFLVFLSYAFYRIILKDILKERIHIMMYIGIWLFMSYFFVPKVTRRITKLYVPNYFIGRTCTVDGLLGDPVNLAFNGEISDIALAFERAGWTLADKLSIQSALKMTFASIMKTSYPSAPVSALYLFNDKQMYTFECEIGNSPRKRHHIRLWKTPVGFHLQGGTQVHWLAAATKDSKVSLSLFTGQVTHKIDSDIDQERDTVLNYLIQAAPNIKVEEIPYFTCSYKGRNGGGCKIYTDGSLKIIHINKQEAYSKNENI